MKISIIKFSYLCNEAHYQFLLLVKKLFETRLDAYTVMNGESVTGIFTGRLNDEIAYFNEHTHRRTKTDIDGAFVASIPDQPYENKPVTPMPEASFDGHGLFFTVDYELSYHDNNAPGTASVTLHGKGAFKGKKTVSFNITGK